MSEASSATTTTVSIQDLATIATTVNGYKNMIEKILTMGEAQSNLLIAIKTMVERIGITPQKAKVSPSARAPKVKAQPTIEGTALSVNTFPNYFKGYIKAAKFVPDVLAKFKNFVIKILTTNKATLEIERATVIFDNYAKSSSDVKLKACDAVCDYIKSNAILSQIFNECHLKDKKYCANAEPGDEAVSISKGGDKPTKKIYASFSAIHRLIMSDMKSVEKHQDDQHENPDVKIVDRKAVRAKAPVASAHAPEVETTTTTTTSSKSPVPLEKEQLIPDEELTEGDAGGDEDDIEDVDDDEDANI